MNDDFLQQIVEGQLATARRIDGLEQTTEELVVAVKVLAESSQKMSTAISDVASLRRDEERIYQTVLRLHERLDKVETEAARHGVWVAIVSSALTAALTGFIGAYFSGLI